MATIKEIESKIRKIALKSSSFKIGKTGLKENERLNGHPKFKRITTIVWSKNMEIIDMLEAKMNTKFINWKTNVNKNEGSAGKMSKDADKYILYVVYTLRRLTVTKKKKA